jgi:hypothetical protein
MSSAHGDPGDPVIRAARCTPNTAWLGRPSHQVRGAPTGHDVQRYLGSCKSPSSQNARGNASNQVSCAQRQRARALGATPMPRL